MSEKKKKRKNRKEKERRKEKEGQEPRGSKQSDRGSHHRSRCLSLALVSLTLSLFACEARPAAADDKTNRQAPFIQSGVMTRDKQPIATDVSRHWPHSLSGGRARGREGLTGREGGAISTFVLIIAANLH